MVSQIEPRHYSPTLRFWFRLSVFAAMIVLGILLGWLGGLIVPALV